MQAELVHSDDFFNAKEEYSFQYVSNLYEHASEVYNFLKIECKNGGIVYYTYKEVYVMIKQILGYSHSK
ncbi:MAG: hypothetical protein ISEC1_P0461 [Thiomicrorhabdus sp.]|nr:MAG: hypothetical protein ISEC1_P0461 [Thiomicrorhabdus sp.]